MTARKLTAKVLTMEVFQRDPVTHKAGPVEATLRGWDDIDAFLKTKGTALVRGESHGIKFLNFPEGWDGMCVRMENFFDDGTSEG